MYLCDWIPKKKTEHAHYKFAKYKGSRMRVRLKCYVETKHDYMDGRGEALVLKVTDASC